MDIKEVFLLESLDPVFESTLSTGNNPNRSEFESMSQEFFGTSTPPKNFKAIVHTADNKWFLLAYVKAADKFLYEKLTAR